MVVGFWGPGSICIRKHATVEGGLGGQRHPWVSGQAAVLWRLATTALCVFNLSSISTTPPCLFSAGLTSHTCSRNRRAGNQAARRSRTYVIQRGERQGLSVWTLAWLVLHPITLLRASPLSITATSPSLAPSSLWAYPAIPLPTACGNSDAARTRHL